MPVNPLAFSHDNQDSKKIKNRNLLKGTRYGDSGKRYHVDPQRFAVEVTGFTPSADQQNLFSATKVNGTSKTAAFVRIALWHWLCFPVAVYDGKVEVGSHTCMRVSLRGCRRSGSQRLHTD